MKNVFVVLFIALFGLVQPGVVNADGTVKTEKVCTTNQYGETTCSEKTTRETVHKPVDAAFGDVNVGLISVGLLAGAGIAYTLSKRVSQI